MHEKDILNKIIDNGGTCDWILQEDVESVEHIMCHKCPLSKLEKRPGGGYKGCYDSLIKSKEDEARADEIYIEAASNKLMDIQIEEELMQLSRKERTILIGNLNKVLYKLLLSNVLSPFITNNDITVWQIHEVEKQWKKLKNPL
jgi:hypothetical protein